MDAQYKIIEKAYKECELDPEKYISYVEGHITGKFKKKTVVFYKYYLFRL